jgi:DNA-binding protein Fis
LQDKRSKKVYGMGNQLLTQEVSMRNVNVCDNSSSQDSLQGHLTEGIKSLLKSAAGKLKSCARRRFLAETVRQLGAGGQTLAERELGWNRGTIRKGMHELAAGIECIDAFHLRGRKRFENRLPNLLDDIRDIVEPAVHVDATLRTSRLYIKMTAIQVRAQLIEQKNYKDEDLPKRRTISTILNNQGYRLRKVKKTNR